MISQRYAAALRQWIGNERRYSTEKPGPNDPDSWDGRVYVDVPETKQALVDAAMNDAARLLNIDPLPVFFWEPLPNERPVAFYDPANRYVAIRSDIDDAYEIVYNIGHEAAHARGERNEDVADQWGILFANRLVDNSDAAGGSFTPSVPAPPGPPRPSVSRFGVVTGVA